MSLLSLLVLGFLRFGLSQWSLEALLVFRVMANVPTQHTDFCGLQPGLFSKFSEKVASEESKIFLANRKSSTLFTLLVVVQCISLIAIIAQLGLSYCGFYCMWI